jgi:mRNA interferase YafQ
MRRLVLTPKFKRAYQKYVKKDKARQMRMEETLRRMSEDIFAHSLSTHKLSGILAGFWACSCGYDCRIIFTLEIDEETGEEVILLLDIGTHDEVY